MTYPPLLPSEASLRLTNNPKGVKYRGWKYYHAGITIKAQCLQANNRFRKIAATDNWQPERPSEPRPSSGSTTTHPTKELRNVYLPR